MVYDSKEKQKDGNVNIVRLNFVLCEELNEGFTYCATAYVSDIENGDRNEMRVNYEIK